MDIKIQSVLIGIIVGWLLSHATDYVKKRIERKRKINAIFIELADLSDWLNRMLLTSKYSIQLAVNRKLVTNVPAKLHKFLLNEYFHEICIFIPRGARLGITDCYGQIDYLNELIAQLESMLENPSKVDNKEFLIKQKSLYSTASEIKFKIDFLIENKDGDMKKLKGAATLLSEKINNELTAIVTEANKLSTDEINEQYYDEK